MPETIPAQFSVLIIDSDPMVRSIISDAVTATPGASLLAETDSPMYGYELLRQNRPEIVFLDLSKEPAKTLVLANRISTFFKDVLIIGSGPQYLPVGIDPQTDPSIATLRACMEVGIRDYMTRPFDGDAIKKIFEKYRSALTVDESLGDRTGRILSVFSNKGGIGKTTIAVNLALALSEITAKPVALVDLNFQLGDITTFLDVDPKQTIVDVARNISRVDAAYLEGSLAQFTTDKASVYVLADPLNVEDAEELTTDQINAVLTVLRASFEYVIIDTTASFDAKTLCALDLSDQILMVSIVNLPSIRSSQRLLNLFTRLGYSPEKIKLILNRYIPDDEITPEDVAETVEHPIFWKVSNNYRVIMTAINRGIPIKAVEGGIEMHKQFTGLARLITGRVGSGASPSSTGSNSSLPQKRTSLLGGLMDKLNKS